MPARKPRKATPKSVKPAPKSRKTHLFGPFEVKFDRSGRLVIVETRLKKLLKGHSSRGGKKALSDPSNTQCCVPQGPGPMLPTCGEGLYVLLPIKSGPSGTGG